MPKYYASQDKTAYKQCRINGKLFMIPTGYADPFLHVGIIRADLRKKYGVPEIKKLADLGPYLEAIKKNEPSMIPMNIDSASDSPILFKGLLEEQGGFISMIPNTYLYYDAFGTDGKMYTFQDEPVASRVKSAVTLLKSWYDSGYINKNVYANKTLSRDSFIAGTSGFAADNSVNCQKLLDAATANGWEVEFINWIDSNGKSPRLSFMMNGVALPKNAKNTERTLMFLDRIISDKDYSMLIYYGIEGTNYAIKDGKIGLPDGITADKNTYPPDASGFWFTDKRLYPASASWTEAYLAERELAATSNAFSPLASFGLVTDDIKTEMANISTVSTQYFLPLTYGLVNGTVDDALKTLNEKLNLAGIDKVKTAAEAYLASIK
jgi:putative aldouronate transport system substrate-binding protein